MVITGVPNTQRSDFRHVGSRAGNAGTSGDTTQEISAATIRAAHKGTLVGFAQAQWVEFQRGANPDPRHNAPAPSVNGSAVNLSV